MNIQLNQKAQKQARDFARSALDSNATPTSVQIRKAVEIAAEFAERLHTGADVDIEELVAYFETEYSHFMSDGRILKDMKNHVPWLDEARGDIEWKFWERYKKYLDQKVKLPISIVNNLDSATDDILSLLENPARVGPWDRRGLVVGSVQSGKTGNYTGLVCKAIDAGYKLIIVLAGLHNSLRSQTQIRTDLGVIGFDTSRGQFYDKGNQWVGVGEVAVPKLRIDSLTTSAENGDFKKAVGRNASISLGGTPYILVIKKNVSILKNVLLWAAERNGIKLDIDDERGGVTIEDFKRLIVDVPFLLIDDEADLASINTKAITGVDNPDDYDRAATNREIIRLLKAFDKSAYIGYTATPFANIFINPKDQADLFPRSFIIRLEQPDNYVGAAKLFGLPADPESGEAEQEPLPLIVEVTDEQSSFPSKYKKDHDPIELPNSLKEAIDAFILVCAARRARGQIKVHNSMLVHVARFVAVQKKVKDLVEIEFRATKDGIRYNDAPTLARLEALWKGDFEPKNALLKLPDCPFLEWDEVKPHLHDAAAKIAVREINGTAQDVLDYVEFKETGRSVIAIGGDKLSRGLTLEGLSISYYLRATKMYDTLMQMGRWFGYRDGYLDLCRLYTTPGLRAFYEWIAMADQELRREFDLMSLEGSTPEAYGLRVRSHPDGMIITALNKSKFATEMQVSFTGELVQTSYLDKGTNIIEANRTRTENFVGSLGASSRLKSGRKDARLWKGVDSEKVARFLEDFRVNPKAFKAQGNRLAQYIRKANAVGDLKQWNVALISVATATNRLADFGGQLDVGLPMRDPQRYSQADDREVDPSVYCLRRRNIITPSDGWIDLEDVVATPAYVAALLRKKCFGGGAASPTEEQEEEREIIKAHEGKLITELGKELTICRAEWRRVGGGEAAKGKELSGRVMRELRLQSDGLLLLYPLDPHPVTKYGEGIVGIDETVVRAIVGFAVCFPVAENAVTIKYRVNEVFRLGENDSLWDEADFEDDWQELPEYLQ